QKGYDLLVIGMDAPLTPEGAFREEVERAAQGFEGALAIVIGHGPHLQDPRSSALRILLPVTGSPVSRRAAEVAVTIARADKIPITALYVAAGSTTPNTPRRRGWRQVSPAPPQEEAILKDVVDLADRYNLPVRAAVEGAIAPHRAILQEARKGGHDLIVMGV